MIILDERVEDSKLIKLLLLVGFDEEAPRVAKYFWLELPNIRERCLQSLQIDQDLTIQTHKTRKHFTWRIG